MPNAIDFAGWGFANMADPRTAQDASADDLRRLLQALVALMGTLAYAITCSDRPNARRLQQDLDNAKSVAMVLMSLLKTERELQR